MSNKSLFRNILGGGAQRADLFISGTRSRKPTLLQLNTSHQPLLTNQRLF